jgi:phage major head subunit gpT-like protein
MVFGLLGLGFAEKCFDGQYFFDTDHPLRDKTGATVSVSNMQAGAGPAWYLLDTSRMIRPIVRQVREKYEFQSMDRPTDAPVFLNDEYLYEVRARVNAGFGLWQLAFASKAALTPENYAAARAAMMDYRSDGGRVLGVMPNTLVVPPALESDALHVLNTETGDGGGSNPWKGHG